MVTKQRDKNKLRVNSNIDLMNDEDERESMKRQFVWLNEMLDGLPLTTMIYDGVEAMISCLYHYKYS